MPQLDRARARTLLTAIGAAALGIVFLLAGLLSPAGRFAWLALSLAAFAIGGLNLWVLGRSRSTNP